MTVTKRTAIRAAASRCQLAQYIARVYKPLNAQWK